MHPSRGELQRPHCLHQRLADRAVAAVQPGDLRVGVELLLLLGPGHLEEGVRRGAVGQ
ncbi:hypothetical protein QFZ64_001529 [Streptomyces sp. B3I8]|nr:hypothetical protein [Streptomyces sp. B3I8]